MAPAKFEFGPILRRRRAELGLTQIELATLAGVTQNYLSLVESGHRQPSLETLAGLAAGLQVPPSYLITHAQILEGESMSPRTLHLADELQGLADRLIWLRDEQLCAKSGPLLKDAP